MTQYYLILINKTEFDFGINLELYTPINESFTQIASSFSADETNIKPAASYFKQIIERDSKELDKISDILYLNDTEFIKHFPKYPHETYRTLTKKEKEQFEEIFHPNRTYH
jgi:hypothetical protein